MTETQVVVHEVEQGDNNPIQALMLNPSMLVNVDTEKLQALFNLYVDNQKNVAEQQFNSALPAMMASLPKIRKDKVNNQTNSKYATLDNINEAVVPVLSEHGFAMTFEVLENNKDNHIGVRATLRHKGGHSISTDYYTPLDGTGLKGNANKTDTHAKASSVSYAKRYAVCALLNISPSDDKDGNFAPKPWQPTAAMRDRLVKAYRDADEKTQNMFIGKYGEPIDGGFDAFFRKCEDAADFQKKLVNIEAGRATADANNS